jgi:hypothetical protein
VPRRTDWRSTASRKVTLTLTYNEKYSKVPMVADERDLSRLELSRNSNTAENTPNERQLKTCMIVLIIIYCGVFTPCASVETQKPRNAITQQQNYECLPLVAEQQAAHQ